MADSTCSLQDCERPARLAGLCGMHYSDVMMFRKTGRAERHYRWATEKRCLVCGREHDDPKRRKVCSGRCQQLLHRAQGGEVPKVAQCQRCGTSIDLMAVGKGGRKKRADTKICDWCRRRRYTRHKVSVMDVVNAHGSTDCGICGDPVDLALRAPDLFRASIDHVLPYSRGGSHDVSNLQLAHLYCNYLKSDREGFTI